MFSFSYFFFTSCLVTSLSFQKSSQSTKGNFFQSNCPKIWEIIQENNIESYTIKCKNWQGNILKVTEETVLQSACVLSNKIVLHLCEKNVPVLNAQLTTEIDNKTLICPFDLKNLKKLINFNYPILEKELTQKDHCIKVCLDLYEFRPQCVILSKIINVINNFTLQVPDEKTQVTNSKTEEVPNFKTDNFKDSNTEQNQKVLPSEVQKEVQIKQNFPNSTVNNFNDFLTKSQEVSNLRTSDSEKLNQNKSHSVYENKIKTIPQTPTKMKAVENIQLTEKTLLPKEWTGKSQSDIPLTKVESTEHPSVKATKKSIFVINDKETKLLNDNSLNSDDIPEENESEIPIPNQGYLKEQDEINNKIYAGKGFFQAEDSHFFFYFLMFSSIVVIGYLAFHNKNKILAYALEGSSGRRNRRRPNPTRYRKLESNLEEAMTSNVSQAAESNVVY